jgi:hypothetical protein
VRRPNLTNSGSIHRYGLHRALLFVDGVGRSEMEDAHDPRPSPRGTSAHSIPGDPFSDPSRPLVLTVASDCSTIPSRTLRDLLSLGRFPGVALALMPGVDRQGYREPYLVDWTRSPDHLSVDVSRGPEANRFRRLEGTVGIQMGSLKKRAYAPFDPSLMAWAPTMFPASTVPADRLALEGIAHAGLGFDYIISPGMVSARTSRNMRWPNDLGACTPEEAFRLVGVKARMYQEVPLLADPDATFMVNVGHWYDLAVMHFTPRLSNALAGSLAPSASPQEAAVGEHLLAIRARLGEMLQARDAIYRLVRRESLGPDARPRFGSDPVPGASGNDLTAQLAYHLTAALNSMSAAIDNAVWVVIRRDEPVRSSGNVGLGALLNDKPPRWARGIHAARAIASFAQLPELGLVLAARSIRNSIIHREGLDYGAINWHPSQDAPIRGLSGIWVLPDALPPQTLSIGEVDVFDALARAGRRCGGDMVVMTYRAFVDALWAPTVASVACCLGACEWTSRSWTWSDPVSRESPRESHLWRTRMQRRLWGL